MKRYILAALLALVVVGLLAPAAASAAPAHKAKTKKAKIHCKWNEHRNGKKCVKNRYPTTPGPAGPQGEAGPQGAQGETGAAGTDNEGAAVIDLIEFCAAHPGTLPVCNPLPDPHVVHVSFLGGEWFTTAGDEAEENVPTPTLTGSGVVTAFGGGGEYASLRHSVNATFGDFARVAYSAGYVQDPDQHGGTPYFRFFFADDPVCGGSAEQDRVVYSANTQSGNLSNSGDYRTFDVTAGTVRYNDDPGAEEATSTYSWDAAQAAFGDKVVCQIAVSMGAGGAYTEGATTTVGSVVLEIQGNPITIYQFGN